MLKQKGYFDFASRRMFERFMPNLTGKKILDVGCGLGMMMEYFANQGNDVVGIDIVSQSVRDNVYRGLNVIEADARSIPFRDDTFDMVYSLGVIEHFEETEQALGEQVRTCKPGGIVVAVVPYLITPYYWAGILFNRIIRSEYDLMVTYGKPFSGKQLSNIMVSAGCERVITEPYYGSAFLRLLFNRIRRTLVDCIETSLLSKHFGLVVWGMGYKRKNI
ncbi:class I SAM-dependent methyltransferase [Thermodesulfobacteriota bacterium]